MAAPTIETSIWMALKTHVQALPLSPMPPIAWPNEAFSKPSNGGEYLRVDWLPNSVDRPIIGSDGPQKRLGMLQLTLCTKKNQNAAIGIERAGQIAAHFRTDFRMTYGGIKARIYQASEIAPALEDDTHATIPVTVRYEVWA